MKFDVQSRHYLQIQIYSCEKRGEISKKDSFVKKKKTPFTLLIIHTTNC